MSRKYNVSEILADLEEILTEDVREIALSVLQPIVSATPVGNPTLWQRPIAPPGYVGGHARGNWVVTVDRGTDVELDGEDGSGARTIQFGANQINTFELGKNKSIFIQNNVPYINRLNNGWSTQAPVGFVEHAIAAGINAHLGDKEV